MASPNIITCILFLLVLFVTCNAPCEAQLSFTFYDVSCPNALSTIRTTVRTAIFRERRMAASIIHLHFHDCFVQGCDASILLDDGPSIISEKNVFPNKGSWQLPSFVSTSTTAWFRYYFNHGCDASILLDDGPSIISEKNALPNKGSVRGYEVIKAAKSEVEKLCAGVVSCADVLTVAARDASEMVGGPSCLVKLGRRDSTTASLVLAESGLPSVKATLDSLIYTFGDNGLSVTDMVALSGAHTIGQAGCVLFRDRIYNNASDIDVGLASTCRRGCPINESDENLAPLDLVTPSYFDNNYFKNLIQKKGLLESDQLLFSGGSTDNIVREYSNNPLKFKLDFAAAMVKMSEIKPLTGQEGVIRKICSALP